MSFPYAGGQSLLPDRIACMRNRQEEGPVAMLIPAIAVMINRVLMVNLGIVHYLEADTGLNPDVRQSC